MASNSENRLTGLEIICTSIDLAKNNKFYGINKVVMLQYLIDDFCSLLY